MTLTIIYRDGSTITFAPVRSIAVVGPDQLTSMTWGNAPVTHRRVRSFSIQPFDFDDIGDIGKRPIVTRVVDEPQVIDVEFVVMGHGDHEPGDVDAECRYLGNDAWTCGHLDSGADEDEARANQHARDLFDAVMAEDDDEPAAAGGR